MGKGSTSSKLSVRTGDEFTPEALLLLLEGVRSAKKAAKKKNGTGWLDDYLNPIIGEALAETLGEFQHRLDGQGLQGSPIATLAARAYAAAMDPRIPPGERRSITGSMKDVAALVKMAQDEARKQVEEGKLLEGETAEDAETRLIESMKRGTLAAK